MVGEAWKDKKSLVYGLGRGAKDVLVRIGQATLTGTGSRAPALQRCGDVLITL